MISFFFFAMDQFVCVVGLGFSSVVWSKCGGEGRFVLFQSKVFRAKEAVEQDLKVGQNPSTDSCFNRFFWTSPNLSPSANLSWLRNFSSIIVFPSFLLGSLASDPTCRLALASPIEDSCCREIWIVADQSKLNSLEKPRNFFLTDWTFLEELIWSRMWNLQFYAFCLFVVIFCMLTMTRRPWNRFHCSRVDLNRRTSSKQPTGAHLNVRFLCCVLREMVQWVASSSSLLTFSTSLPLSLCGLLFWIIPCAPCFSAISSLSFLLWGTCIPLSSCCLKHFLCRPPCWSFPSHFFLELSSPSSFLHFWCALFALFVSVSLFCYSFFSFPHHISQEINSDSSSSPRPSSFPQCLQVCSLSHSCSPSVPHYSCCPLFLLP